MKRSTESAEWQEDASCCVLLSVLCNGQNAQILFSLNDLQKVTLRGDSIEGLHNSWVMVLSGLSKAPDLDVLEYCYFQQVKGFRPLSEDIAHYNREEEGSKDHSYEFLYDAVNRHPKRTRQHKMREALSKGRTGTSPSAPGLGKAKKGRAKTDSALAQQTLARA